MKRRDRTQMHKIFARKPLSCLKPLSILLTLFLIVGCSGMTTQQDENIAKEVRDRIHKLNDELMQSFTNNDPSILFNLFTPQRQREYEESKKEEILEAVSYYNKVLENRDVMCFGDYYVKLGACPRIHF